MKITPVLYMDRIEPSLAFWADRLGFEKTVEVPARAELGFVILQHGAAELMLRLDGVEPLVPVRTTFYGMKEIIVREPGATSSALRRAFNVRPAG